MSTVRTLTSVVATAVFVYVLYLSTLKISLSSFVDPATLVLASACVVSSLVVYLFATVDRGHLQTRSGAKKWVGWIVFSLGLLVYLFALFSSYLTYLHWISLWIMLPGISILMLGYSNSSLVTPALASLFLIAPVPPTTVGQYGSAFLLLIAASAVALVAFSQMFPGWTKPLVVFPFAFESVIVVFPSYTSVGILAMTAILSSISLYFLRKSRGTPSTSCELDDSAINFGRRGCMNCGRVLESGGRPQAGEDALIFGVMLVISILILAASIPLLTANAQDVDITSYSASQASSSPFISAPSGFLQNYSSPSPVREIEYNDQLVVVKHFYPSVHPENFSYTVFLELSYTPAFLVKHWEYLAGYNRTTEFFNTNGSSPVPVYSTLLRANGSAFIAISYEVPVNVLNCSNGQYTRMYLGVSTLAYPSYNLTRQGYEAIKRQVLADFVAPETRLLQASAWTNDVSDIRTTLGSAEQYASLAAGATLILGVMGVVLNADRNDSRLLDSVDDLSYGDQLILSAAAKLGMRKKPRSGGLLLSACRSSLPEPLSAQVFYTRLLYLEKLGYFLHEPILSKGAVRFMWRLRVL